MADQSTATSSASAKVDLHCHCKPNTPPTGPDIPRGIQVPNRCLVLEYQGQCILVARPFMLQTAGSDGGNNIKGVVDVAREAFGIPQDIQEISLYTTKLQPCYGRKVKIWDTAWPQVDVTKEFDHLLVEVGGSFSADELPVE